ncbi:M24 family metallopeptidase [Chloroflexota bacterium]
MISSQEIDRRKSNLREGMAAEGVDALIVCGNDYTGFEGAVRYISGFEIVHRYVYVLLPLGAEPKIVFPTEARWIGDKSKTWIEEKIWDPIPGKWLREYAQQRKWKRLGIYGLDYIMAVRDYCELQKGAYELVPFDYQFDMARAVKSEEELAKIRNSMDIILDGFWALVQAYQPGKTEAEIMAPPVELFTASGGGSRMMNILLSGTKGEADAYFKIPGSRIVDEDDLLMFSLEITGSEGYWVEFSRPLIRGKVSQRTQAMMDVYPRAVEAARRLMRDGEPICNVHTACAEIFGKQGFMLGHLTGHSIGMTMIEHPKIGANTEVRLRNNMIVSFHPQVLDRDSEVCLYMQDTYQVGDIEGECLASIPMKFFNGTEVP